MKDITSEQRIEALKYVVSHGLSGVEYQRLCQLLGLDPALAIDTSQDHIKLVISLSDFTKAIGGR